jgi:hypothetical protein
MNINPQIEFYLYIILTIFVLIYIKITMLKQIGKEWKKKEEGGTFTADHLSPSQLNMNIDQWHYNYNVLTAAERKKLPANLKMIFGGLVGQGTTRFNY